MSETPNPILVPIRLDALVINQRIIDSARPRTVDGFTVPGDGCWSPMSGDQRLVRNRLQSAGPAPFFGAEQNGDKALTLQQRHLPKAEDQGVYLRWLLPVGLRRGDADLSFPAMPDQWLVVRTWRTKDHPQVQSTAWFLDGGLIVPGKANLLVRRGKDLLAHRVGKVIPLADYNAEAGSSHRVPIKASGSEETANNTFTASVADNQNVFSYHDTLSDLIAGEQLPEELHVGYQVIGWYRDSEADQLQRLVATRQPVKPFELTAEMTRQLDAGNLSNHVRDRFADQAVALTGDATLTRGSAERRIIDRNRVFVITGEETGTVSEDIVAGAFAALGWQLRDDAELSASLASIYHGQCLFVNFWDGKTYRGPLLGYPGAPGANEGYRDPRPTLRVGIGATAQDALVSLAARNHEHQGVAGAFRHILEAAAYGQLNQLEEQWDPQPQTRIAHQASFQSADGGVRWHVQTQQRNPSGMLPSQDQVTPTPPLNSEQKALLDQLNEAQKQADTASRELAVLQQMFRDGWRQLLTADADERWDDLDRLDEELKQISSQINANRNHPKPDGSDHPAVVVSRLRQRLSALLASDDLALTPHAGARYWEMHDPVILIQNRGSNHRHDTPNPLPCRTPDQLAKQATTTLRSGESFKGATPDTDQLGDLVSEAFPKKAKLLKGLLHEGFLLESAFDQLVTASYPKEGLRAEHAWDAWMDELRDSLYPDREGHALKLTDALGRPTPAFTIADHWRQQPWSPLHLDWEITWYPSESMDDWQWQDGAWDFVGKHQQEGHTLRGRSLAVPIADAVLAQPLNQVASMLDNPKQHPSVQKLLAQFNGQWRMMLDGIREHGLMGQALSGLHAALRNRDPHLPRIKPNANAPWLDDPNIGHPDAVAEDLLKPFVVDEGQSHMDPLSLAPPADKTNPALRDNPLRAGYFVLNHLWMVDDFGQWVDLRFGSSAGGAERFIIHPALQDPQQKIKTHIMAPPRLHIPSRLRFRWVNGQGQTWNEGQERAPLVGWLSYNMMDDALVVNNARGRVLGHFDLHHDDQPWQPRVNASSDLADLDLQLQSVIDGLQAQGAARALAALIDQGLGIKRPNGSAPFERLVGRPLAVMRASFQLETFDGSKPTIEAPLQLGRFSDVQDGLYACFTPTLDGVIPAYGTPEPTTHSRYVKHQQQSQMKLATKTPKNLLLLMDPHGEVNAATGILPDKSINIPESLRAPALADFELSFQVGPLLSPPGPQLTMPLPGGVDGSWQLERPGLDDTSIAPQQGTGLIGAASPELVFGRLTLTRAQVEESQS